MAALITPIRLATEKYNRSRTRRSEQDGGGFIIVDALTGSVLAGRRPRAFSMTIDERQGLPGRAVQRNATAIDEDDIWRAAALMTQCFRREASTQAAMCADELLAADEVEGSAMWKRIVAAIEKLQAPGPTKGEAVHWPPDWRSGLTCLCDDGHTPPGGFPSRNATQRATRRTARGRQGW